MTKKLLAVICLSIMALYGQAQSPGKKPFSGKITYTWEYANAPAYTVSHQRNRSVFYIQGAKMRLTEEDKYLRITDYYFDTKAKTLRKPEMVNDQKIELVLDADMSQITGQFFQNLTLISDTKTIAGYTCKKAVGSTKVGSATIVTEVWYTDEITVENGRQLWRELPGVPLEFSNTLGSFVTKQTAIKVESGPVDAKLLEKPAGLKPMTPEERNNLLFGDGPAVPE